jgi:hypothetical protein
MSTTHGEPAWHDYPPPPPPTTRNNTKVNVGFVLAAIGVLFIPIAFCTAALVLGIQAHRAGDRRGRWVIAASVVCFILGITLAMAVLSSSESLTIALG